MLDKWYEIHWSGYVQPWNYRGPNTKQFPSDREAIEAAKLSMRPHESGWQVVRCEVIYEHPKVPTSKGE